MLGLYKPSAMSRAISRANRDIAPCLACIVAVSFKAATLSAFTEMEHLCLLQTRFHSRKATKMARASEAC